MNPLFTLIKIEDGTSLGANAVTENGTFGPAPVIVPFGASSYNTSFDTQRKGNTLTTVNVTNDYPWTNAPPMNTSADYLSPRYDVPSLELREETILQNPALNNIARNLFITADNVAEFTGIYKNANGIVTGIINAALGGYIGGKIGSVAGTRAGTIGLTAGGLLGGFFGNNAVEGLEKLAEEAGSVGTQAATRQLGTSWSGFKNYDQYLAPYQDIYTTRLTGWRYKLPYMSDTQRTNLCSFQDGASDQQSMIAAAESLSTRAASGTNIVNALQSPGIYIDRAKSFAYGDTKSYTVDFPLLNTRTQEEILRNWQLLFLLTYQNRPNRIDRVQVAPPKIYEAMIPGVWYSRYSYISNLSVSFVGNRRKMTLMVPVASGAFKIDNSDNTDNSAAARDRYTRTIINPATSKTGGGLSPKYTPVTTIIPDAYQVSLTVQELVPESQNTMFAAIQKPNTISVGSFEDGGESYPGMIQDKLKNIF